MRKLGNLLKKPCQKTPRSWHVLLRVLFPRHCFCCERKYLKDDKDNKLLLALKICTDSCPWTLSVPWSSQLASRFALGQLFAYQNRYCNILGQLSVHISSPKVAYCLYNCGITIFLHKSFIKSILSKVCCLWGLFDWLPNFFVETREFKVFYLTEILLWCFSAPENVKRIFHLSNANQVTYSIQ